MITPGEPVGRSRTALLEIAHRPNVTLPYPSSVIPAAAVENACGELGATGLVDRCWLS